MEPEIAGNRGEERGGVKNDQPQWTSDPHKINTTR